MPEPMQPTWESGNVKLWLGDCLAIMPTLSAGSIGAVVTDPPYGINNKAKGPQSAGMGLKGISRPGKMCGKWTGVIVGDDRPFDCSPLLRFKNLILWGANYYHDKLPPGGSWLVWNKKVGGWKNWDQGDGELAWCSFPGAPRIFDYMWMGLVKAKVERGSDPRYNRQSYHPNEKPVQLLTWCLEKTTGTVLDPYMGSGTTGVACVQTGRAFVGIEIVEEYFETAKKRIVAAQQQLCLVSSDA